MTRPPFCADCPIGHLTTGYVPLLLRPDGDTLDVGEGAGEEEIVQERPFVGGAGRWRQSLNRAAKRDDHRISIVNVIGCRPPENVFPGSEKWTGTDRPTALAGVEHCRRHHLEPALDGQRWVREGEDWRLVGSDWRPKRIVALGGEALHALTGMDGILRWRGSPLPLRRNGAWSDRPMVMPTLHPAYLMRSAGLFSVARDDLSKPLVVPPEDYSLDPTVADLEAWTAREFAFDLEWDPWGTISLVGLSGRPGHAVTVPWRPEFQGPLQRIFENATDLIGHNIVSADWAHIERLGWRVTARLWDTLLMQSLVQPDMRHGLAFVASVFTGKVFWKGDAPGGENEEEEGEEAAAPTGAQWRTWNDPSALPRTLGGYGGCASADEAFRLYNARDTDAAMTMFVKLRNSVERYGLMETYRSVLVPATHECREMSARAARIDKGKVGEIREVLMAEMADLEVQLPEGLRSYEKPVRRMVAAPPNTYRPKTRLCRGSRKAPHTPTAVVFLRPDDIRPCSVCEKLFEAGHMTLAKRIAAVDTKTIRPWNSSAQIARYAAGVGCAPVGHLKTRRPTTDKRARQAWGRKHPEFVTVNYLRKRVTLLQSFVKSKLLDQERVFFRLIPWGTAEGRLSCKGLRPGIDPNIQNQPKVVRKIFVPERPGWGILEGDWVQGENWLTAWLAKDMDRLERLAQPDYDEHSALASRCFGVSIEEVRKDGPKKHLRDIGKVVNHGGNYGMGPVHLQELLAFYEFEYPLGEVKRMIDERKALNPGTTRWQQEVVQRVRSAGYLTNPFGRRRWFQNPRDFATRSLAFGPASTLADMMLRVIVALAPDRYPKELATLRMAVTGRLPKDWHLAWVVHDSFVCQGPHETRAEAASVLRAVMEQPWAALDGFALRAELKYSTNSWGDVGAL